MKILLNGRSALDVVLAETDIKSFRETFRESQNAPEKIPAKLKPLITMPDFPEKLVNMLQKAVA